VLHLRLGVRRALVVATLAVTLDAHAVTVLTVGKSAVFRRRDGVASAVVRFGHDPAFAAVADPTCTGGATMTLQVAAYPQATVRVDAQPVLTLPCERWKRRRSGFVYRDPDGTAGGVRKVVYGRSRFLVRFEGGTYRHVAGPVGYAELWIEIAGTRLVGRFHDFRTNEADRIVARQPSAVAAAGEAGFWSILHGVDHSPARQEKTLALLTRAVEHDRHDGRSAFLLAMLHLYRFGQSTIRYDDVSAAARAELVAANDAFARAVPLLWDGQRGDSRVPGFAAAATFGLGVVDRDAALQAKGLTDLEAAVAVNPFFNVFDLIPVVQALAPSDPRFQQIVPLLAGYIADPATLQCVVTQPEICSDQGLAPRNVAGALLLFGDVYAKAAALDSSYLAQAETWYGIAAFGASQRPGYLFADAVAARVGHAADRAALYQDADPTNDPPLVGAGPEACAVCHYD
jgi:hypothetical protein